MSSHNRPPLFNPGDDQDLSGEDQLIEEIDENDSSLSCLQLIDRVRRQPESRDADWFFGDDSTRLPSGDEYEARLPKRIGRFEIVRRLGRGGYGTVLLALDPDLNRHVALKVPNPEVLADAELQRRFLLEGEAAAALRHPHIVTVHEAGQVGAVNYIASEYIEGGTLAEWLSQNSGKVGSFEAARLVKDLSDAVQHAHARGVLHRDIKPGNVLLDRDEGAAISARDLTGAARLTDFGLARIEQMHADQSLDASSESILGTPAYMSPEQAAGRSGDVDVTSDVYALGVILHELLVGKPPFRRSTRASTLKAIRSEELPSLSLGASRASADLEAICLKCLQKEQSSRYATAAALGEDLQHYLDGEPVTARRATKLELAGRWFRRNPTVATLISLVAVLTLVLAIGSSVAALWLNDSRQQVLNHLDAANRAERESSHSKEEALRALFKARVAQAQASQRSNAIGQRIESLAALEKAAPLISRLGLGDEDILSLRNEVIACMPLIDLADDRQWPIDQSRDIVYATDSDVARYAVSAPRTGNISIHGMTDNEILAELRQSEPEVQIRSILFSPDGEHLACAVLRDGRESHVQVWHLPQRQLISSIKIPFQKTRPFDFSHDGERFAVARLDGAVEILELPKMSVIRSFPGTQPAEIVRCHPGGTQIGIRRPSELQIIELKTGRMLRAVKQSVKMHGLEWSDDGLLLAAAVDHSVTLWRTVTGNKLRVLKHPTQVERINFHPNGRILATFCHDRMTRLWDVNDGNLLLTIEGEAFSFSDDGMWLGKPGGRWWVSSLDMHRSLRQPRVSGGISSTGIVSVHPNGRLLAASNRSQTIFWDLSSGTVVAKIPNEKGTGILSPTGEHFFLSTMEGLFRRTISRVESDTEITFRLGPLERLAAGNCGELCVSHGSNIVSCVDRYYLNRISLYNEQFGFAGILEPRHEGARWIDIQPGGELLATGAWRGKDVCIWNARNGSLVRKLPTGNAKVAFSPNGALLAIDEGLQFSVWNVSDWTAAIAPQANQPGSVEPGCMGFSPDGRILAMLPAQNVIRLLDTSDFLELGRFELPDSNLIESVTFSPSGDRLFAGVRGTSSSLQVWNLQRLRTRLGQLQLDWDHPRLPDREDETKLLVVTSDE